MRNITVTVGDDVYRRARVWAAEHGDSLSAVVRYLLETLPGIKRAALAFPARGPSAAGPAPVPSADPPNPPNPPNPA
ncbi:MAG: hypothetical protein ABSD43_08940 [Terracidiphilus sp.]|jgi:hypothetical protein